MRAGIKPGHFSGFRLHSRLVLLATVPSRSIPYRPLPLSSSSIPFRPSFSGVSIGHERERERERETEFSLRALTQLPCEHDSHFLALYSLPVRDMRTSSDRVILRRESFIVVLRTGCCSTNRKLYDGKLIRARESAIACCKIPWRATEMLRCSECSSRPLIYDT